MLRSGREGAAVVTTAGRAPFADWLVEPRIKATIPSILSGLQPLSRQRFITSSGACREGEAWMHAASRRSASRRALANGFGAGWPNIHRQHHAGFCLGIARSHGRAASRITVLSNGLMSPSLWFGSCDIAEQVGHHRHL